MLCTHNFILFYSYNVLFRCKLLFLIFICHCFICIIFNNIYLENMRYTRI